MAKTKSAGDKGVHGRRYSDTMKRRVIDFVTEVNLEKGRGGIAAAAKKFGASPLSISNWIKESGANVKAAITGGQRGRGDRDKVLHELTVLNRTIAQRREELEKLEARFEKLKASL